MLPSLLSLLQVVNDVNGIPITPVYVTEIRVGRALWICCGTFSNPEEAGQGAVHYADTHLTPEVFGVDYQARLQVYEGPRRRIPTRIENASFWLALMEGTDESVEHVSTEED
jgi:hypothetical protein